MPSDVVQSEEFTSAVQGPAGGDPRTATSVRAMGSPLASRTLWTWRRLQELVGAASKVVSVDAPGSTLEVTGHGLVANDPVYLRAVGAGAAPGGTAALTLYYVLYVDADHIQLSLTSGGAALGFTTAGAAPLYIHKVGDAAAALFAPASGILPAGTLRGQLTYLRDNYGRKAANNTWTGAQTFSGGMNVSSLTLYAGDAADVAHREAADIPDSSPVNLDYSAESYLIPNVSQNTVINLPAVITAGRLVRSFRRNDSASGFNATVKIGGTTIATFPGGAAGKSWAEVETKGGTWTTKAFGGAAVANA